MIKLAVFDLDGTLLESIHDIADTANYVLCELGQPQHSFEYIKAKVGYGIKNLVNELLPPEKKDKEEFLSDALKIYLAKYTEIRTNKTRPYPGIEELLTKLKADGVKLAVLSNKIDPDTQELTEHYFPRIFDEIVGKHDGISLKPDPTSLKLIMAKFDATSENTAFIGDSEADVTTAINAGVVNATVTWGFRTAEQLKTAGAVNLFGNTSDLYSFLAKN